MYPDGSSEPLMIFVDTKQDDASEAFVLSVSLKGSFQIGPDGSFTWFEGFTGTFTLEGFSGATETPDPNLCGGIEGDKLPKAGFALEAAGYYEGSLEGDIVRRSDGAFFGEIDFGNVAAIVAGNGEAFASLQAQGSTAFGPYWGWGAGVASLSGTTLTADHFLSGEIDFEAATAAGSFFNVVVTQCIWFFGFHCADYELRGTWTMARQGALINRVPEPADDAYAVLPGRVLEVEPDEGLLANDKDLDVDALSAQLIDGPAHGTLDLTADGGFDYAPDGGFRGVDGFTYRASDGLAESVAGIVTIEVTAARIVPGLQYLLLGD